MCSTLPTTLLPNGGYVMDTWSTCPCTIPRHAARPIHESARSDIDTENDRSFGISNISWANSREWWLVQRLLGMTGLGHSTDGGFACRSMSAFPQERPTYCAATNDAMGHKPKSWLFVKRLSR